MAMLRRPKPGETEEDLLAFQTDFLAAGERPAARLGGKRRQDLHRDVVRLDNEGLPAVMEEEEEEAARPPPKRSKFKERREQRLQEGRGFADPHKAMDQHDTHITKILSDIKERDPLSQPQPFSMPARRTKHGFPTVHKLAGRTGGVSLGCSQPGKSLFAEQFELHSPGYFGIEPAAGGAVSGRSRDVVEPVDSTQPLEPMDTARRLNVKDGLENRLPQPSLISGEGLVSVGVAEGVAKDTVAKIHQENVERLVGCSEEEILKEKERILQLLDPKTVAFLKSKQQTRKDVQGGQAEMSVSLDTSTPDDPSPDPPAPTGWLHMDAAERNKMEWMADVAAPPVSRAVTGDVRFSLDGLVVPSALSLPSHLGLHHHGNDPQAAGYTLAELLPLCRSAVLQQRTLALQTLARVVYRARRGEYLAVVMEEEGVLSALRGAGLPLLLRLAVDDSSESVFSAAVHCLHALLVTPLEEQLLDEYCCCCHGYLPALKSHDQSRDNAESGEKESDLETIKRDVVMGLVRMDLPNRLRYILEVCRPPRETVGRILELLIRLGRHSLGAASAVVSCPRLVKVVIEEFLPLTWSQEQDSSSVAHGRPQVAAMKLLQVLCSAGRNIAAQLVSQYSLPSVLTRYTVVAPSELGGLDPEAAHGLATWSLCTWATLLHYSLATQPFRDIFPEFLRQLQQFSSSSPATFDPLSSAESVRLAPLLQVIRAAVGVASLTPDKLKLEEGLSLPTPSIVWADVSGLLAPLRYCLDVCLVDDRLALTEALRCVANLLHCLADCHQLLPTEDPVKVSKQIEELASGVVSKLAASPLIKTALQTLKVSSALSSNSSSSSAPLIPPPPSLPSHLHLPPAPQPALYGHPQTEASAYQALLQPQRDCLLAANLVLAHCRLAEVLAVRHKGVTSEVASLLQNQPFLEYLECFIAAPPPKWCSSLEFPQLALLLSALKLFTQQVVFEPGCVSEPCLQLFHHVGFKLFTVLPPGWEWPAIDLFSTFLLHPSIFSVSGGGALVDLGSLSLRDPPRPSTALTPSPSHPPPSTLLTQALASLPSIARTYRECLERSGVCSKQAVEKSKALLCPPPSPLLPSLLLPPNHAPIAPLDWPLLPLLLQYSATLKSSSKPTASSRNVVVMVTHTLQLLLSLELLRPRVLREVPTSAKLARLMCTFLIDSDLFLEPTVHSLLSLLLRLYTTPEALASLNFDQPIPGLSSFQDLYSELLSQFAAVSYGDALFASFTLLPLQQTFSASLRRLLWGEHASVLRLLALPLDQLPVDVKCFLEPAESDPVLLEAYLGHLATGTVRWQWSPLFYLIAVHHVHCFVFLHTNTTAEEQVLQTRLLEGIIALGNRETRRHLLLYEAPDAGRTAGLLLREGGLSEGQKERIRTLLNRSLDYSSLL